MELNEIKAALTRRWKIVISALFVLFMAVGLSFVLRNDPADMDATWTSTLVFLLTCLASLALISIVLWHALRRYVQPETTQDRRDFLDLFMRVVGGTTLLISLFTTWKSIKDTQHQLSLNEKQLQESTELSRQTLQTTQASLDAARRQQIEERFYKAVEKLESTDAGIRTGAVYSLGKIAEQSDDHYWQVLQILTGYVREKYRWNPRAASHRAAEACPPDLQAVFSVIGKRKNRWDPNDPNSEPHRLDFSHSDLRGLILRGNERQSFHFEGLVLVGANLEKAQLNRVILDDVAFDDAIMTSTSLFGCSLTGAAFSDAIFDENTDLMGTELTLSVEAILDAKNFDKAKYPDRIRDELKQIGE
jgi:hypothetical protein